MSFAVKELLLTLTLAFVVFSKECGAYHLNSPCVEAPKLPIKIEVPAQETYIKILTPKGAPSIGPPPLPPPPPPPPPPSPPGLYGQGHQGLGGYNGDAYDHVGYGHEGTDSDDYSDGYCY